MHELGIGVKQWISTPAKKCTSMELSNPRLPHCRLAKKLCRVISFDSSSAGEHCVLPFHVDASAALCVFQHKQAFCLEKPADLRDSLSSRGMRTKDQIKASKICQNFEWIRRIVTQCAQFVPQLEQDTLYLMGYCLHIQR